MSGQYPTGYSSPAHQVNFPNQMAGGQMRNQMGGVPIGPMIQNPMQHQMGMINSQTYNQGGIMMQQQAQQSPQHAMPSPGLGSHGTPNMQSSSPQQVQHHQMLHQQQLQQQLHQHQQMQSHSINPATQSQPYVVLSNAQKIAEQAQSLNSTKLAENQLQQPVIPHHQQSQNQQSQQQQQQQQQPHPQQQQQQQHQHQIQHVANQNQQKEFNIVSLCRYGQETIQDILSRFQEVFGALKSVQPPNTNLQATTATASTEKKITEQFRTIRLLFKRLRLLFDKCNDSCQLGMEYTNIESLIPLKDDSENKLEPTYSDEYKKHLQENRELTEAITLKNKQLREIIDRIRIIIWEINTMLSMRRS